MGITNRFKAIYTLNDPRDDSVFYVGQTSDIPSRYQNHMSCYNRKLKVYAHIADMLASGVTPEMVVIEWVEPDIARARELFYIDFYSAQGSILDNFSNEETVQSWSRRGHPEDGNQALRQAMIDLGLTPVKFSARMGYSRNYIFQLLSSRRKVSDKFKWEFAQVFGFEAAQKLFDNEIEVEP